MRADLFYWDRLFLLTLEVQLRFHTAESAEHRVSENLQYGIFNLILTVSQ